MNQTTYTIRTIAVTFILTAATLLPADAQTNIRRVVASPTGTTQDGSTWAVAMSLQAALTISRPGDQVWVAAGTYKPHHADDRTVTFRIPAGVLVYGGFVGDEAADFDPTTTARTGAATILSGDLSDDDGTRPVQPAAGEDQAAYNAALTAYTATRDDNSNSVVRIAGRNVTLDGLTITAGQGGSDLGGLGNVGAGIYTGSNTEDALIRNCIFTNNELSDTETNGGGAYFTSDVTLIGCAATGNRGATGGGIYFRGAATLTDCTFTDNHATTFSGGGVYFEGSSTLTDCIFNNNSAGNDGGGAYFFRQATLTACTFTSNESTINGGGAYFRDAPASLTACTFTGNEARGSIGGGGVYFNMSGTLTACTFTSNTANTNGGGAYLNAGATLANCVVANNTATTASGGGIYLRTGGTVINSTFYKNKASTGGGGAYIFTSGASPSNLRNNILIGNTTNSGTGSSGQQVFVLNTNLAHMVRIQNNLIEGGAAPFVNNQGVAYANDAGDITVANTVDEADADAVFASTTAVNTNYLRLRAGSPALNVGNNDYVNNAVPRITTDAAGETRIQGGTVDLGAYEGTFAVPTAQTITFTSGDTGGVGTPITLAATGGASGNPVTFAVTSEFEADGTTPATAGSVATLGGDGTTLMLIGEGMVLITATQAGDATRAAGTQTQTITVMRASGVLRVTTGGDADADGSTWALAMTLEAALMAATTPGDQVWIAAGTYKPHATDQTVSFSIPAGVVVYGGFAGTEAALADRSGAATILSGDLMGNDDLSDATTRDENSNAVVTVDGADATLDGLTIQGGDGGFVLGGTINGAGLYSGFGSVNTTVNACVFMDNTSTGGGGGAHFERTATVTNCVFANNHAGGGGGIVLSASGTVINSTFYNNTTTGQGGGISVLYNDIDPDMVGIQTAPFNLRNNILIGNTAATGGHQLYVNNTGAANVVSLQHNLLAGGAADIVYATAGAAGITEANTVDATDAAVVFESTATDNDDYLRLKAGSPAVNAGNNDYVNNATPPITTDAAGVARIQIGTVDLGAYESAFKTAQTIDFTLVATAPAGDEITLTATGGASGLPVSFASSDETVAAIGTGDDAGKLLLKAAGTAIITASQSGNDTYAAATAVMQTIEVIAPTIRRVVVSSTATTQDGTTWENAMTLQDALAITTFVPGDQLWIQAGTYKPHATDKTVSFTIPAGVRVYGGFVGDEAADFNPVTTARTGAATILSGDLSDNDDETDATTRSENSNTVVTVMGANVVLDGLTITAGKGTDGAGLSSTGANTAVTNCTFTNNTGEFGGGASFEAIATVTNCDFTNNTAEFSGGGAFFEAMATLTNCDFTGNTSGFQGGGADFNVNATVTNCTFTGNTTGRNGGGGAYFRAVTLTGCTFAGNTTNNARGGGAFFLRTATLTNCTFMGNTATFDGGGAIFDETATLTSCTFMGNTTTVNGGGAYFVKAARLTNSIFANNTATENGGGLSFNSGGTGINTTFYNNTANSKGGGISVAFEDTDAFAPGVQTSPFNLQNSLLLGNSAMDDASGHQLYVNNTDAAYVVNLQHNLLAGGAAGIVYATAGAMGITEENTVDETDATVVFEESTATDNDDYLRLKAGSPAISAGNNDFLNNGTPDNTEDDVTTDLAGNVRIQGGTVDLGAYESDTKLAQAIMFMLATPGTVGEKPDLIATSDASLEVTFASSDEAVAAIGTGADAGKLVLLAIGTATITASQSGDDTYAAATPVTQMITVEAVGSQAQTITFTLPPTGTVNDIE